MSKDDEEMCGAAFTNTWQAPKPTADELFDPHLYVMNSLTRKKEHFLTMDGSKNVVWYICGPTVYAESHMGHARTYLGFDIIRRIMQDYFGYNISLIMNITDLDDKIIQRSFERNMTHSELSKHYENEFHIDMQQLLNVQPPTVLTRVTEYMDEIVQYIQSIIDKGLAYESNGSVYFNVDAFGNCPQHCYCKLLPEQMDNANLLSQGEGHLNAAAGTDENGNAANNIATDKKSPRDFALWKRVKSNEPSWPSPWGEGRPGWHIECSVMASDVMQRLLDVQSMDIHAGGVDLKFPHHDNEMAQAEAASGQSQWVNYFVHAGHLHIKGLKMSKSLKNFITIRQALEIHTARQVRLLFLLHKYNSPMDYADTTMVHAIDCEKKFVEFFHNCKAAMRNNTIMDVPATFNEAAIIVQQALYTAQDKVDKALRDDFDTPAAINALLELVKATHVYLDSERVLYLVIRNVAVFVTRILGLFGINTASPIGFAGASGEDTASREETLQPVLDALMQFRAQVRDQARLGCKNGTDTDTNKAILQLCDEFRDIVLPPLGIQLEDITSGANNSVWKLADPAELQHEMEQKRVEAERKAEIQAARAQEEAAKDALNRLSPADYFQQMTTKNEESGEEVPMYSKYDPETGIPTHDAQGEPLNKNQSKKVQKLYKTQQAKYEKYQKSQQ